mmetsp:Transcript_10211/g.17200  ORF Transcript_10211/g.17200 Transcript_10211/m.17200 type:complete len:80 (+) Transcript_10211:351-590(+)
MPELCLNICNACVYTNELTRALQMAERAIESSDDCVDHISRKLNWPVLKDIDLARCEDKKILLLNTQHNLNIQALEAKG